MKKPEEPEDSEELITTGRRRVKVIPLSLYVVGCAIWGFACMTVTRSQFYHDDSSLTQVVKWVAGILAISLPIIVISLREADSAHRKYTFEHFITSVVLGTLITTLLGAGLEIILLICGVRHFLGIPVK